MKRYVLYIGAGAVVAALSGGLFALTASGNVPGVRSGAPTEWPKNAHGITYGSAMEATSLEDEPDLILIEATNGAVGYAYRTELEGPEPSSPAAAVAEQKARGDKPQVVPVYEADGVTQIGVFLIEHELPK